MTRPAIPDNYQYAVIIFRVIFKKFSYASDRTYACSPPSYHSIFNFIPGSKGKLQFLQIILKDMCKTGCHCDALFDVFAENMHPFMSREHENALSQKWASPNNYWKYFFMKSIIMIRIFQHKNFPSVRCGGLVLLCPDFQKNDFRRKWSKKVASNLIGNDTCTCKSFSRISIRNQINFIQVQSDAFLTRMKTFFQYGTIN